MPKCAKTAVANWKTQYQLTVNSPYESSIGEGWYYAGSLANFGVSTPASGDSGVRYIFTDWNGAGNGSYSGTSTSQSVNINSPIVETANWQIQYQVLFTSTPSFAGINVSYGRK